MPQIQMYDATPDPLAQAAGRFGEGVISGIYKHREQDALDRILKGIDEGTSGEDVIKNVFGEKNLSFDKKQELVNKVTEVRKQAHEIHQKTLKEREAKKHIEHSLKILNRQRELLKTGHLGPIFAGPGKTSRSDKIRSETGVKTRAEYERLGKSLIQASSNIPIRNRLEFETLAADLYDSSKSKEEIEGILDAMQLIIEDSISSETGIQQRPTQAQKKTRVLRDAQGNIYDIPEELYEKAKAQGLKE